MLEEIRRAIANHPGISLQGILSLVSYDKKAVKQVLKQMKADGKLEVKGRYYKLTPMYKQIELAYE